MLVASTQQMTHSDGDGQEEQESADHPEIRQFQMRLRCDERDQGGDRQRADIRGDDLRPRREGQPSPDKERQGQRQRHHQQKVGDDVGRMYRRVLLFQDRIGPEATTLSTVEPMRSPPASTMLPPAMPVVAMEAISQGASPTVMIPSRSGPLGTRNPANQEIAGRTLMPTNRAITSGRHREGSCRSVRGSMLKPVENTRMARRMFTPWWRTTAASGACTVRPMTAATRTITSSR